MRRSQEYKLGVEQCRRFADQTADQRRRRQLLIMAEAWEPLTDRREADHSPSIEPASSDAGRRGVPRLKSADLDARGGPAQGNAMSIASRTPELLNLAIDAVRQAFGDVHPIDRLRLLEEAVALRRRAMASPDGSEPRSDQPGDSGRGG